MANESYSVVNVTCGIMVNHGQSIKQCRQRCGKLTECVGRRCQLQKRKQFKHTHLVRTLLFAFVFTILPCLVSTQDEPSPPQEVKDTVTDQLPTVSYFDDLTAEASTDLPEEMAEWNVTFFEQYVWPTLIETYNINESNDDETCGYRDQAAQYIDFTNGGFEPYCRHKFDKVFCWAPTPPGTTVYLPCKSPFNGVSYEGNVSRTCLPNGTWADGGKSIFDCIDVGDLPAGNNIHQIIQHKVLLNIGYILSLTALVGAFFIFLFFKSLRCVRNNIHWNLITSFIILYVLFYIASATQRLTSKKDDLKWLCRIVMCLINNAVLTNFFWMLIEGVYLHLLVVRAMTVRRERFWMYMMFGWGCPIVFTLVHVTCRIYLENKDQSTDPDIIDLNGCWLDLVAIDYLIYGPVIACILINLAILIHVIAILVSKLRASHSFETQQYWKSVRATFILLPLLGGAYFLFIHQPKANTPLHDGYGYFQVFLQSLQGFFVALFYVYMNQEVIHLLKRKYRRWQESHSIQVPRTSMTYHSIIPFPRKGSTDSGASRKPNKLYPPGRVPSFVPGEAVPLQCKMDCTPNLGMSIQEWASEEKGGSQLPNGSVKNGLSNGTTTPLVSANGNNNEMESVLHGDMERVELNSNNHNDSTYTSIGSSPDIDNGTLFSEDSSRPPGGANSCYRDVEAVHEPLLERRPVQHQPSTSSSCPLLEVDQREKQVENHGKWSPKVLLKKLNPHMSMPQQTEMQDRQTTPIPEVKVDSIQLFTETPCGTPV